MPSPADIAIVTASSSAQATEACRGQVLVSGSYGGEYNAYHAGKWGLRGVVLNDAGIGRDRAGIRGLDYLDRVGLPGATADVMTCHIADGDHMLAHGLISHVNAAAAALGCAVGQSVRACAEMMRNGEPVDRGMPPIAGGKRYLLRAEPGEPKVIALDAAPMLEDSDTGAIAITGSHAALFRGQPDDVIRQTLHAVFFSDAGVGLDRAGIRRLPELDKRGIPAGAVAASSAPIGDARAIYADGILSHVNETAATLGAAPGMKLSEFVELLLARQTAGLGVRAEAALNIGDLHRLARLRLPRILFDCIESGTEGETALAANEASFGRYRLMPRHLVDVSRRDASLTLFGRRYAQPFGIGPTGFAGLFRPGADGMLARTAAKFDIPFILSGASVATPEDVASQAPKHLWYHLYAAKDPAISSDLMRRVAAAGVDVLVLTVDNPVPAKRERDIRNGFSLPLKLKPSILLEALTHPGWILDYVRTGGLPSMGSWQAYAPAGAGPAEVGQFFRSQSPSIQAWDDLERFRAQWRGRLVVKGLQNPDDARRALSVGVDGIIVSNHGGKAYDMLPIPLFSLPAMKAAVGGRIPVVFDGGVRRGSDILIARALGADFIFVGRATLYGVVAGAQPGAERAVSILADEVDRGQAMIGCPAMSALDRTWLANADGVDVATLAGRESLP